LISSEYTINEYVHNVPRKNLKTIQEYLHNAEPWVVTVVRFHCYMLM